MRERLKRQEKDLEEKDKKIEEEVWYYIYIYRVLDELAHMIYPSLLFLHIFVEEENCSREEQTSNREGSNGER